MARTPIWRRRVLAGAAVAIAAITLTACGSKSPGSPTANSTTPHGDSFLGGAPTGSPTASAGNDNGGGNSGGGNSGGNNTPTFPSDAKAYGLTFLQAMGQHDSARVKLLAVSSVVSQVADSFYNVNTQWSNRSCGQDPNDPSNSNKLACVYDNAHGDEINLVLSKTQLGGPTAVLEVQLDKTTYPDTPDAYVQGLFSAYQNGNINRVVRLSNSTVKGKLSCKLTEGGTQADPPTPIDGTYSSLTIHGASAATSGYYYTFKVLTSPGGKAGAVKDITAMACP